MTATQIGKFLVVCALASDLNCPTYVGGGTLHKDSKLATAAARFKVNARKSFHQLEGNLTKRPQPQTIVNRGYLENARRR